MRILIDTRSFWTRLLLRLVLLVLWPVQLVVRFIDFITGKKKPEYRTTIEGEPLAFVSDKPLAIALWAPGLSMWEVCLERIFLQMQEEFRGRCEFAFVELTDFAIEEKYNPPFIDGKRNTLAVPNVIIRHRGREVTRLGQGVELEEFRSILLELLNQAGPQTTA